MVGGRGVVGEVVWWLCELEEWWIGAVVGASHGSRACCSRQAPTDAGG
jgi:hypothetical protein